MRYDAEHKARTRRTVVRVASEAIRANGPQGVGVAEIMARAGLTHGGFYAHFESKDALVAAALDEAFETSRETLARTLGDLPPAEALRTYVRAYLSRSHRDGRATGCPVPALAADLPRMAPLAKARFGEGVAALTARLAGMIAAGGQIDPGADTQKLAASVLAEMQGAVALARAVADPAQSDAILFASRRAVMRRLGLEKTEVAA